MAICILLIVISMSLTICSESIKSVILRKNKDIINKTIYAVGSDLRYNISFEEIIRDLEFGEKIYSFNIDTIKELQYTPITELEEYNGEENYLKLSLKSSDNVSLLIGIQCKYNDLMVYEEVVKSRWMDEI